jgi:hypothetical protein
MNVVTLILGFIVGLLGLIGLLMSACGGYVTLAILLNEDSNNSKIWDIPMPSLGVGSVLVLIAVVYFRGRMTGRQQDEEQ